MFREEIKKKKKGKLTAINANSNLEDLEDGLKKHKEKIIARELRTAKNWKMLSTKGSLMGTLAHGKSAYWNYQ